MPYLAELGPLAHLVGTWEGSAGKDLSPADPDATRDAPSDYRERAVFEATGRIDNHQQHLYGVKYSVVAWRIGEPDAFHDDTGYWLWDADRQIVMKGFIVPRGVAVLAGGTASANATSWSVEAHAGHPSWGITSQPFLQDHFRTVRYRADVQIHADGTLTYSQDTVLKMTARDELFHHTDTNTLRRIG